MQEKFPVMGVDTDKDSAIYKLKNKSGTYDEIAVSSHHYQMHGFSKYVEEINIQSGLTLFLIDIPADVELEMHYSTSECPIGFGITLECDHDSVFYKNGKVINSEKKQENCLVIGKSNNTAGTVRKEKGRPLKVISIVFDSNLARVLFRGQMDFIKDRYRDFFGDNDTFYEETYPASPTLLAAARAILTCPFSSPKRELYFSSRVHELLNYVFSEFMIDGGKSVKKSVLQPGEVEKMQEIKDYLLKHMSTPPGISELSRISGINEFKLKAGFKEVFGTTVYGFIQSEKMAHAKTMLETGGHTVSEVAWDVGYTNVSHFIKAFKKHYRVTPGQVLFSVKNEMIHNNIKYSAHGNCCSIRE